MEICHRIHTVIAHDNRFIGLGLRLKLGPKSMHIAYAKEKLCFIIIVYNIIYQVRTNIDTSLFANFNVKLLNCEMPKATNSSRTK